MSTPVRRLPNRTSDLVSQAFQEPCEPQGDDVRDDHDTHVAAKCILCEAHQHIHDLRTWCQEAVLLWTTCSMMIRHYDKPADPHKVPYRIWEETTLNGPNFVYGASIAMQVRATVPSFRHYVDATVLLDEERLAMVKKILFELCFRELELRQSSAAVLVTPETQSYDV